MSFFSLILNNVLRRKVRSLLTGLGVAIAVAATVALISFSTDFEHSSAQIYTGRGVDMVVVRAGVTERVTSNLNEQIVTQVARLPNVATVAPSLTDMVSFGEGSLVGIPVHGWPPDSFLFATLSLVAGRRIEASDHWAVMLGQQLAENLKKHVGDMVEIESQPFHVVGIFHGLNQLESVSAIVKLSDLQQLMDRQGQVTEIQVRLEPQLADREAGLAQLRREIGELHNPAGRRWGLAAQPTQEFVTGTSEIKLAKGMALGTSLIALVIGSIGVLNTMMMSVLERTQEIGVLRAIGWPKRRVMRMIVGESLLLALSGALLGLVGGWLLMCSLVHVPLVQGLIQPQLPWSVLAEGLLLAVVAGLIGGGYPAYRGARMSPSEALRYE